MNQLNLFFTQRAWEDFQAWFNAGDLLKTMQRDRLTLSIVPKAPPRIIIQGANEGLYHWVVLYPVDLIFSDPTSKTKQTYKIRATIRRSFETNAIDQVKISELLIKSVGESF